jgi:hypothetical protein
MLTIAMRELVAEKLNRPVEKFGNRRTDLYLARAVIRGDLGRKGESQLGDAFGTLDGGVHFAGPLREAPADPDVLDDLRSRGYGEATRRLVARLRQKRTWYLPLDDQIDQGNTPKCVAATGEHWEMCEPRRNYSGLGFHVIYDRCKAIDGAPNEEGTWASALLRVYQDLGMVKSSWWWTSPADTPAIDEWLLNVGPMWWGVYMPESMFRTYDPIRLEAGNGSPWSRPGDKRAIVKVEGPLEYGHEMLLIGTDRKRKTRLIQQSWGRYSWGVDGRAEVPDAAFDHLMAGGGDLFGVIEQRRAA